MWISINSCKYPGSRLCRRKKRHGAQNNFRGINVPTQTNGSVCVCLCAYQSTINTSSACLLFRVLCVSCWDEAKWVRIALQHISYIFAIQCVLESSSRSLFVPRTHNPYLCTCYFAISHPHSPHSRWLTRFSAEKTSKSINIYPWKVECESVPSDKRAHHAKPWEVGRTDCVCFCSRAAFYFSNTFYVSPL